MGLIRPMGLIGPILLAACSSSDSSTDSTNQMPEPIEWGPAMGFSASFANGEDGKPAAARATRGVGDGEFDTDTLKVTGFGVYCWYTGTSTYTENTDIKPITQEILMLNQQVVYNNSTDQWTYSPTKYWPLNASEKLTLRAYAPYVSYQLQTDANGMPWMPVVVTKDDYHNGTQHDPLWGTSKHEGTLDSEDHAEHNEVYGQLYNNYTYKMSGNWLDLPTDHDPKDTRDGTIDWFFHHGMSKLMFALSVIKDPGCSKVTIKSIKIENLYDKGLLSLGSLTRSDSDKPNWKDCDSDEPEGMTVTLSEATPDNTIAGDLAPREEPDPYPFVINIEDPSQPTAYFNLLEKGLLIIPRDFTSSYTPMKLTITYTVDSEDAPLEAKAEINDRVFYGNTSYTLKMNLTPSTKGLEITTVQSAFTKWSHETEGTHEVYNW